MTSDYTKDDMERDLNEQLKELIGHDLPFTDLEVHQAVEDQYVKAKYYNREARQFIALLQTYRRTKE